MTPPFSWDAWKIRAKRYNGKLFVIASLPDTTGVVGALLNEFVSLLGSLRSEDPPASLNDILQGKVSLKAIGLPNATFTVDDLISVAPARELADRLEMSLEELTDQMLAPKSPCRSSFLKAIVLHRDHVVAEDSLSRGLVRTSEITTPLVSIFSRQEALELLPSLRQHPAEFVYFASHLPERWSRELTAHCIEAMLSHRRYFEELTWLGTLLVLGDAEAIQQGLLDVPDGPTPPWSSNQLKKLRYSLELRQEIDRWITSITVSSDTI